MKATIGFKLSFFFSSYFKSFLLVKFYVCVHQKWYNQLVFFFCCHGSSEWYVEQGCCFRAIQTLGFDVMKQKIISSFKLYLFLPWYVTFHEFSWHLEFDKVRAKCEGVLGAILLVLEQDVWRHKDKF
jgi:hypothetical protein